jgi:hypothetical protein
MDVIETKDPNKHPAAPVCWRSPSRYIVGVDLGQSADPTAVCVLNAYAEREDPAEPMKFYYDVQHLMRLPLGMSYPAIVQDVGVMLQREPLKSSGAELVIDETGVGRAVGDIFVQQGLKPIRVSITAGDSPGEMSGNARYTVSKSHLVSALDAKMHTGELRIAKDLRESPALESELKDFRRHVSNAGRYSFSARSGQHDDLVLAVAIALWRATKKKPSFVGPSTQPKVVLGYPGAKGR